MSLKIETFWMTICASGKLHGQKIAKTNYEIAEAVRDECDYHPDKCGPHLLFAFGGTIEQTKLCELIAKQDALGTCCNMRCDAFHMHDDECLWGKIVDLARGASEPVEPVVEGQYCPSCDCDSCDAIEATKTRALAEKVAARERKLRDA